MNNRLMLRRMGSVTPQRYFVRPSTTPGTYGTEDGSSYANAWNGFSDIDWASVENNILAVCGTHTEQFTVQSNCTLVFNDVNEIGEIDATGINTGIFIDGYDATLESPVVNNANVHNVYFENSTSIVNNGTFNNCANQGVQHWSNSIVTYNGTTTTNGNSDEGFSGHLNAEVTINGTWQAQNNTQAAANFIEESKFTFNCVFDFLNNGTYDIWGTNNTGANLSDLQININTSSQVGSVRIDGGQLNIVGGDVVDVIVSLNSEVNIDNSIVDNFSAVGAFIGIINTINDSLIKNLSTLSNSNYNLQDSRIGITGAFDVLGDITAKRCLFDAANSIDHTITCFGGVSIDHCIFINTIDAKFSTVITSGATVNSFDNNTFYQASGSGRGILTRETMTANNLIMVGLSLVTFTQNSATLTLNNSNLFNSSGFDSGNGTSVSNNEIAGDPLFEDASTLDLRLATGSPCIGAGVTTTNTEGIDTANWGNGSTKPTITSKTQTAPFDLGAYVD